MGAEAISIYTQPGTEYNLSRCRNYVYNMAGNAVDALIKIEGTEGFLEGLKGRHIKPNPKYIQMIEDEREKERRRLSFEGVPLRDTPNPKFVQKREAADNES